MSRSRPTAAPAASLRLPFGGDHAAVRCARRRALQQQARAAHPIHVTLAGDEPGNVPPGQPAVRRGEGVLVTGINSVEIECLPGDLIDNIRVDLERLASVGDALYVKDLDVPAAVKVLADPEEMVARVTYLAAEEVVAAEAPTAEAEPEVIARGKVEEEGEEE